MAASMVAIRMPFFQNVAVVRLERGLYVCAAAQMIGSGFSLGYHTLP